MQSRSTSQKRVVLDIMRSARDHPSAQEVYDRARELLPSISLGTVYRILNGLVESGRLTTVDVSLPRTRYDFATDDHAHVVCTICGRVVDLHGLAPGGQEEGSGCVRGMLDEARRMTDYTIPPQGPVIRGICPRCRRHGGAEQNREVGDDDRE